MGYPLVLYGFEDKNQDRNRSRDECQYDKQTRGCESNITDLFENSLIRSEERLDDSGDRYEAGALLCRKTLQSVRGGTHTSLGYME